ncbi:MAG: DUF4160 domain-containing protein [bacterium]
MPTVLRIGAYRFYFYSYETTEPPHIHIDRDNSSAKFWIDPIGLARNFGYSPKELTKLRAMVIEHRSRLMESWNGYFGISR